MLLLKRGYLVIFHSSKDDSLNFLIIDRHQHYNIDFCLEQNETITPLFTTHLIVTM